MSLNNLFQALKGGAGSGNRGHSGVKGHRGGSAPKGGGSSSLNTILNEPTVINTYNPKKPTNPGLAQGTGSARIAAFLQDAPSTTKNKGYAKWDKNSDGSVDVTFISTRAGISNALKKDGWVEKGGNFESKKRGLRAKFVGGSDNPKDDFAYSDANKLRIEDTRGGKGPINTSSEVPEWLR